MNVYVVFHGNGSYESVYASLGEARAAVISKTKELWGQDLVFEEVLSVDGKSLLITTWRAPRGPYENRLTHKRIIIDTLRGSALCALAECAD